jgi:hypothetical protein
MNLNSLSFATFCIFFYFITGCPVFTEAPETLSIASSEITSLSLTILFVLEPSDSLHDVPPENKEFLEI